MGEHAQGASVLWVYAAYGAGCPVLWHHCPGTVTDSGRHEYPGGQGFFIIQRMHQGFGGRHAQIPVIQLDVNIMVVRQCGKRRETDDAGAAAGEPGIGIFRQTRQQPAAGNTVISVRMVCGQPVRWNRLPWGSGAVNLILKPAGP